MIPPAKSGKYLTPSRQKSSAPQLKAQLRHYKHVLLNLKTEDDFDPVSFHALYKKINIQPDHSATVIFKDDTAIWSFIYTCKVSQKVNATLTARLILG